QTALIDYYLVADQLFIWVVTRASVVGVGVEVEEKRLAQSIDDFRSLMQNFSTTSYLGSELADLLLKPITPWIASRQRLIIVPHKVLHFLPFASLPWESGLVVDRFTLSYVDSAVDAVTMLSRTQR